MSKTSALKLVFVIGTLLAPLTSHADAYADLQQARDAFNAVHSWHAVEHMPNGHTVTVDHVTPDRWRIQMLPNMSEILIGGSLYLVHDGKTMHMPFVMPQIQQIVNQNWLAVGPEVKSTARDLGMQQVNGRSLHAYAFTSKGTPVKLYLSGDHLPAISVVTSDAGTVRIFYSGYNSPITISPP